MNVEEVKALIRQRAREGGWEDEVEEHIRKYVDPETGDIVYPALRLSEDIDGNPIEWPDEEPEAGREAEAEERGSK